MKINIQLFGGRGTSSGGNTNITAHKLPEKWKPNSTVTRYDKRKTKREKRYYDSNGEKWKDTHYMGPPNHNYPHEHYWTKDENGNWKRTPYDGGKK